MYTYESNAYNISWYGVDLSTGWGADTFLTISPQSDRVEATMGADGKATFSKIADKSAKITMNFTQAASDELSKIYTLYAAQDVIGASLPVAPFLVRDSSESGLSSITFACLNAVLTAVPENTFGRASTERTFTWIAESYLLGGDISAVTGALASYIK